MHLTPDAAEGVGVDITGIALPPRRRLKAAVPTDQKMAKSAAPLRAIFCLEVHGGEDVLVRPVSGAAKFDAIRASVYGPILPEDQSDLVRLAATVARVDVFELCRPQRWSACEIADAILAAAGERP